MIVSRCIDANYLKKSPDNYTNVVSSLFSNLARNNDIKTGTRYTLTLSTTENYQDAVILFTLTLKEE